MNSRLEASETEISRERLAFTIYYILRKFDPDKTGYLTPTRFNKVAYLIHRDIKENMGINTGLPWHWYLFGPVVELEYCPSSVYEMEALGDNEWRLFYNREPGVRSLVADERSRILRTIELWRDKYLKTKDAIDLAYAQVEAPFLREIKQFSDWIADPGNLRGESNDIMKQVVHRLDQMARTYPDDDLAVVLPTYLKLDNMLRVLVEVRVEGLAEYAELIEEFRKLVLLRMGVALSENMPEAWIDRQLENFASGIQHFRVEFDEAERNFFNKESINREDRTGYAKRLMEISWQMYTEG